MSAESYADVLTAYEGVERLDAFAPGELRAYRDELLGRTEQQARFLEARLAAGARVLEIGSGNGRLPIALAQRGLVGEAWGSRSRAPGWPSPAPGPPTRACRACASRPPTSLRCDLPDPASTRCCA